MKATRTLAICIGFISTLIIFSCNKTDVVSIETNDEVSAQRIVLVTDGDLPECATNCINFAGPYIESTGSTTYRWGNPSNPQNWKTINYVAYNTATSFVVKVTFTHSGGNSSNTVSVTAFSSTQFIATLASGATHTFTFALPEGWNKCDVVPFSIYQEGQNSPVNMSCSYNLYGICANRGCETSFTGEAIACSTEREAEYTFTSKDALTNFKIQGGLTNFTGADAEVTVTGGSNITKSQWTPGGSSNRVIKVEGSVGECETIKIRIKWNSTNLGGEITGSWSVKDGSGVEIAPAVVGLMCN